MSSVPTSRLSDETRFELSLAAGAKERRNRPRWLVIAAGLLLALVGIAALAGWVSRRSAITQLDRALQDQAAVEGMTQQLSSLSGVATQAGDQQLGAPMANLRSTLEGLATRAGMASPPVPRNEDSVPQPQAGIVVKRYSFFDVRDPSLTAILEWLRLATQDPASRIPGLEVETLRLKPENNQWSMNLILRRWERAS
jgi:hypothetical protein